MASHLHEQQELTKFTFGYWIYIMSDCILFAMLFATFAVLHSNTFGGPSIKELASMPYIFIETMLLLFSSFSYGLGMMQVHKGQKNPALVLFGITFLLGLSFVGMEINEFMHLIHEGFGPDRSAFLSAFFTLVGTHGLHVTFGLLWMAVLIVQLSSRGTSALMRQKLSCFGLFWHFLDVVWIFVFTLVYLMGAV
jgi:cytochrome o ubiquinol oxidase subunit 3